MYDIVFISYQESNAEENFLKLKERFPSVKRVHGVKGIHQAHIAAAKKCFTKMFWIVDGDAQILNDFNFDYVVPDNELNYVHVWRSINPVNDLIYGYGGVKLFPKHLTLKMNTDTPDMTTSISILFKPMPQISNITAFNVDPYSAWRSAFRECAKLSSKIIDRQKDDDSLERLHIWQTRGIDKPYGKYAINGAIAGSKYGTENKNSIEALRKINDFDWLRKQFNVNI